MASHYVVDKTIIIWQSVTASLFMKMMNCTSNHTVTYRCQNVVCSYEWQLWFSMCAPVVCSQFVTSIEFKIVQSDCGTNLGSAWYPRLISGFFSKSIGFAQLNFGLSNSSPSSRYECLQTKSCASQDIELFTEEIEKQPELYSD